MRLMLLGPLDTEANLLVQFLGEDTEDNVLAQFLF